MSRTTRRTSSPTHAHHRGAIDLKTDPEIAPTRMRLALGRALARAAAVAVGFFAFRDQSLSCTGAPRANVSLELRYV